MTDRAHTLDLVIIGGGPAGMATALIAGRARLHAAVINAETPRNAAAHASHGFLTRDGTHALELLAIAKDQLAPYTTVTYRTGTVARVERVTDAASWARFDVHVAGDATPLRARRVVIATGQRSDFGDLNLPDVAACYGKSVFPCPFCDGFENADRPFALFTSAHALHYAQIVGVWSRDLYVFSNGTPLADDAREALSARGIPFDERPIVALRHDDGALCEVVLDGGDAIAREIGFLGEPHYGLSDGFADALGGERDEHPFGPEMEVVKADDFGVTGAEGVFVVGDTKRAFAGLTAAARDGELCAQWIVREVSEERWAERLR